MELLIKVRELVKGKKLATMTGHIDAVKAVASGKPNDPEQAAGW